MTNTITPNMGLTVPTPGSEPGPLYAQEISNDQVIIDTHDHSLGNGVQITPAGLNINSDLTIQNNNVTNQRSSRFIENPSTLGGVGDTNCVYDVNGDLWFNNGVGTPIQITAGSVVDVSGPVVYSTFATTGNVAIAPTDNYVMIACDPTSNPITITLPVIAGVPTGRLYIVKDSTGKSQTNNITVNPAGSNTVDGAASLLIDDNFWSVGFVSDGTSNWHMLKWNKYSYQSGEVLNFNYGSTITGFPSITNNTFLSVDGFLDVNGILVLLPILINSGNSPYTITGVAPATASIVFLVNTNTACTIVLPPTTNASPGMVIIIKDYIGKAATNNITIQLGQVGDSIEGIASNYIFQTNGGSITLINCDNITSQNWAVI